MRFRQLLPFLVFRIPPFRTATIMMEVKMGEGGDGIGEIIKSIVMLNGG